MLKKSLLGLGFVIALAQSNAGMAQTKPSPPDLGTVLDQVREAVEVSGSGVAGRGAEILRSALGSASFIAVGEDHVTREIPMFVSQLCDMVPAGELSALVLEIGPEAAHIIDQTVRRPDRLQRMAELNAHEPGFVAFLDTRADNDMAAHCAARSTVPSFRIYGLDQEYVGSAGFLLDAIAKERLSPEARTAVDKLKGLERQQLREALASGDSTKLLLLRITDEPLNDVEEKLRRGGTVRARALFASLRTSAEIYRKNATGSPDSNLVRALLMKRNFEAIPRPVGKTIMKFGDWHLYKGVNPLGERDIGNHVAEIAEGRGQTSLHILVLGARGVHAFPEKFGQPLSHHPFRMEDDRDYHWLKLALDRQVANGWTLFDLRRLRHRRITGVDVDWRRVIDGYDLMIIVPEFTPSETIGAN